ncbi:hypothetical protein ABIB30_005365 [Pedobacter sp. UYP1]
MQLYTKLIELKISVTNKLTVDGVFSLIINPI